jgi:aldose 1-epimerase
MATDSPIAPIIGNKAEGRSLETVTKQLTAPNGRAPAPAPDPLMIGPSGQQVEISHGDQRVLVVEVGGGLRTYSIAGRAVLDGYGADEMSSSSRGQVLIPWPNRLENGSYEFAGGRHQAPIDDPAEIDAIHGLVRWASWTIGRRRPESVVMEHLLHPRPGYPFSLALRIVYALSDTGLSVTTTATNCGPRPCPYGCGFHPYLTLGTKRIDSLVLRVPGGAVLTSNERGIPSGRTPVEGTEYDFRRPRPIGPMRLDSCFTDLERGEDGLAHVRLEDHESGDALTLWVDNRYGYLMLFTGDPLPDVNRRSLAVEPMSCPPNAFRSGEGLIRLEAGASFTSWWGITPHTAG